jgi:hypothetical protein
VDVTGLVTAGAAGLAAVLAGANLWISGRRELNKWKREALVEAFVTFLDASFKQNGTCTKLTSPGLKTSTERHRLHIAAVEAHDMETDTLTRLRLLAPSRLIAAAEALHEAEHRLVATCFTQPLPLEETLDTVRLAARSARVKLLESARQALRLRDTAAIGHSHRGTGWYEFRSLIEDDPGQQTAPNARPALTEESEPR